jgi:enoyl-CoA hydratase
MFKNLTLEKTGFLVRLTIQRPEALNALNIETLHELEKALEQLAQMPLTESRVLIVTGAGPKAFVAGADIKEMADYNTQQASQFSVLGQKIFSQLENLKIPVIAAVNGFALGGGLELALACDFIYASDKAKFGLPEVTLGLIPGFGGTVRLTRAIGPQRARELIYSGALVGAEQAMLWGFVNKVCSSENLIAEVEKLAQTMAARGPVAVSQAKKSIREGSDLELSKALSLEAQCFSSLFQTVDVREGTKAFIEKRTPEFKGK